MGDVMDGSTLSFSARTWLDMIFEAKAREIGRDVFVTEVQRRGFHLIEAGNQFIVVCNQGPMRVLFCCRPARPKKRPHRAHLYGSLAACQ